MKTLLAIEWLKIRKYRTFWILIGFFLVLLPLWNYQIGHGMIKADSGGIDMLLSKAYSFPEVWGNVGFWGSIFVMFLSILVIIIITNEYNYRTHRQNVIDGWSRLQFFHAKIGLVLFLSLCVTLYVFITGLLLGLSNSGGSMALVTGQLYKLGYFFLLSTNYMGFGLLLGLLIRRSGLAIGLFLLYCLILENLLEGLMNWKLSFAPGDYLPLQSSDELLPLPLVELFKGMIAKPVDHEINFVIASIAWCAIYYFIGRRLILRSDW